MKKMKLKVFYISLCCIITSINIDATCILTGLGNQKSLKETTPIYSDRIISTQTGNFHDVFFNLTNLEKIYTYEKTLQFNVIAGVYEINIILACSDEFEIDLSSDHHDLDFKPLHPALEVPDDLLSYWKSIGRVDGIHDVGVYVYTIKGISPENQTYNVSLQFTPDHDGYPHSFYYNNENREHPVEFLVDPMTSKDNNIELQSGEDFSTDYIIISTEPKELFFSFWPSSDTQNNWISALYDISKKGNYIVEIPESSDNGVGYYGLSRKINPGIYKYQISVGSASSSAWEMRSVMDAYNRNSTSEFYMPKVPFFNRIDYDPDDENEGDGEGKLIIFSYDDTGNRIERKIILPPQSHFSKDNRGVEQMALLDKVADYNIKIYPNPTYGQLAVEFSDIKDLKNGQITILSFGGGVILRKKIDAEYIDLDISSRPSGIYLMHIQIDGEVTAWKIIKQ